MRGTQLRGALGDLGFQLGGELIDLVHGQPQAFAHGIERPRQMIEFLAGMEDVDGFVEVHGADRLGALDQLLDGHSHEALREKEDEDADQQNLDAGNGEDAHLHLRDFAVRRIQIQRQVQHPQYAHRGGMRMAGGLAASRFIEDRRYHGQVAPAITAAKNADAVRHIHLLARRHAVVAAYASVRARAGIRALTGHRGKHQMARTIEHADAVDALLEPDGLHHFVGRLAMVVEHGVPGGAGDAFGKLVGARDHGVEQVLLLGFYGDESGDGADHDDDERQGKN